uniref:REC114 meiotic recombination protein n=1 Tax=Salmo trutta TaxID=8032 RepID=A0A674D7G6_SALTR
MFEPSESAGELVLTLVESGHMLVSQGHDLLDGFSLLDAPSFLKVQQKSDTLLFRLTVKGESRQIRMQFSGSRAEALEECSSAVLRLKVYLPVTTQGGHHHHSAAPQHPISPLPRPLHRINRRVLGRLLLLNLRSSRALYPSNVLPSTSWASMVCPCPWCTATVLCSIGSWSPSSACVSWTPASLPWWRRWKGS